MNNLVTTPWTHLILGTLSSRSMTSDPSDNLPCGLNFLTEGGSVRMYSFVQTDQNLDRRLSHKRALSDSALALTESGSSTTREENPVPLPVRKCDGVIGGAASTPSPTKVRGRELTQHSISSSTVSNSFLERQRDPSDLRRPTFTARTSLSHHPPHQGECGTMNRRQVSVDTLQL